MMAVETNPTNAPIHANRSPASDAIPPTVPRRLDFPIANSVMMRGMDQIKRNMTHGMRKDPPPFCAAIRENLQMFPVPTAIPMTERIIPQREVKNSFVSAMRAFPDDERNVQFRVIVTFFMTMFSTGLS